jgi:hypothetical protein
MTRPLKFFNRFGDLLDLILYWIYAAGAAASATAMLVAIVLAIVYANRLNSAEHAGSLLGTGLIGFVVFLILARQARKQRTQSREFYVKVEGMAKRIEEGRRQASAQGSGSGKSR